MAETTKNTVMVAPMPVKESPNSRISQGNSGGSRRWKKCETPWTKPISEMVSTSRCLVRAVMVLAEFL